MIIQQLMAQLLVRTVEVGAAPALRPKRQFAHRNIRIAQSFAADAVDRGDDVVRLLGRQAEALRGGARGAGQEVEHHCGARRAFESLAPRRPQCTGMRADV